MPESGPNTAVVIIGRRLSSYRAEGKPVPVGFVLHKCKGCRSRLVISPKGEAQMKAAVTEMKCEAITVCGTCAVNLSFPADTTIVPTEQGERQLAASPVAREYLEELRRRIVK